MADADELTENQRLVLLEDGQAKYRRRARNFTRQIRVGLLLGAAVLLYGQVQTRDLASQIQNQRRDNLRLTCQRDHREKQRQHDFLQAVIPGPLPKSAQQFLKPMARDCDAYARERTS